MTAGCPSLAGRMFVDEADVSEDYRCIQNKWHVCHKNPAITGRSVKSHDYY